MRGGSGKLVNDFLKVVKGESPFALDWRTLESSATLHGSFDKRGEMRGVNIGKVQFQLLTYSRQIV